MGHIGTTHVKHTCKTPRCTPPTDTLLSGINLGASAGFPTPAGFHTGLAAPCAALLGFALAAVLVVALPKRSARSFFFSASGR